MQQVIESQPTQIDRLAYDLTVAKLCEEDARKKRIAIEEAILALADQKEEGTATTKGDFYKVSVVTGFTRKIVDPQGLAKAIGPEKFEACVRTKYELNMREVKALDDAASREATRFIEARPKKPSLKVEEI
ncbi:hypothetical protein A3765_10605 [Oleiphilus sp. HI0130]|nr:hypothetical protein A3765_10605 [Oleiphilus sp. HI0130]